MTRQDAVLEFFIIEASEYIDRLDLLLAPAGSSGPDPQALARQARALRGSATMYRQPSIARLAMAVERAGLALREGRLRWDVALRGALVAAVDDLRILVRAVRSWGENEERRATARSEEMERFAPPRPTPGAAATPASGTSYVAAAVARLADALDQLIAMPSDRPRLSAALDQVRAVRGLAALRDAAPLPEVCDAVERAVDVLDAGEGSTRPRQLSLLAAAAAVLRRAASDLSMGRTPTSAAPEVQRFAAAAAALADDGQGSAPPVVPIAELFFPDGKGLVEAAANPPQTSGARFRLELVSHAEHLRRLAAEGRSAAEPIASGRIRRDLRAAIRAIGTAARSFGQDGIAAALLRHEEGITSVEPAVLARVEEIASVLTAAQELGTLASRLDRIGRVSREQPEAPSLPPAFLDKEPPLRPRSPTPTGKDLFNLLEHGIERLGRLRDRPLTPPVPLESEEIVPIESLLYRGSAALQRARDLRDQVRKTGEAPSTELVDELVDLVALAGTE